MDTIWSKASELYFNKYSLVEHQISSYDDFIINKLPKIINSYKIEIPEQNKMIEFEFINIEPPISDSGELLYPYDTKIRDLTYQSKLYVNIRIGSKIIEKVCIASIPTMVLSCICNLKCQLQNGIATDKKHVLIKNKECFNDIGGYFIINGNEKILKSQDRMSHNEIFVFKSKMKLSSKKLKRSITAAWSAEVRSFSEIEEPNLSATYMILSLKHSIYQELVYVDLPNFKDESVKDKKFFPIPWIVIVYLLDMGKATREETKKYIFSLISKDVHHIIDKSIDDIPEIETQNDAILYMCNLMSVDNAYIDNYTHLIKNIVKHKLFQNIKTINEKKFYFIHMTELLLLTSIQKRPVDDRDNYGKKRVDCCGMLMNNLFKSILKRTYKSITKTLEKTKNIDTINYEKEIHDKCSKLLKYSFATGNWTCNKSYGFSSIKSGVSELLNRHNYISTLSSLRRISTPTDINSRVIRPRFLHSSQLAYICPAETPEGASVGMIKNMAMMAQMSSTCPEEVILDYLKIFLKEYIVDRTIEYTKISVNGVWVYNTPCPDKIISCLRSARRSGKINHDVSISLSKCDGVRIYTDSGRLISPFFIVYNGQLKSNSEYSSFDQLMDDEVIEWLDPNESETLFISLSPWELTLEHTHSIIHPQFMLGVSASTAPFPDHNQSPRNIYQSAMGKQSLGLFCNNYMDRFDTSSHILMYPQKPLVNTQVMKLINSENLPSGQNIIVAVACYGGWNQEDSVILNQSSIDRGLFRSYNYTTYTSTNKKKMGDTETITFPDKGVKEQKIHGYNTIQSDGLPLENTPVEKRSIVIGKVWSNNISQKDLQKNRDISIVIKPNGMEENSIILKDNIKHVHYKGVGYIDKVIITTVDNNIMTKVRVRQTRIPQIGDKFASRSAQKGIMGMGFRQEDMPYSMDTGVIPDLIVNPNAFPSRMTIAQPLECLLSKLCSLLGQTGDCSPFIPNVQESITKQLEQLGFNGYGDETLINGMTGEIIPCKIFIGPTYYQRLKHMVDDKIHSRDLNGPREQLTRQPCQGKKHGGGFKIGEMETWCGVSHGASNFLIDRLVNNSDPYNIYICDYCGNTANANTESKQFECKRCNQSSKISKIKIPYAFKLLQQELMGMGMGVWYEV